MGVKMQRTIYDSWSVVMNHNKNPLKNIPDTQVRHMIMQVLAWPRYRLKCFFWFRAAYAGHHDASAGHKI